MTLVKLCALTALKDMQVRGDFCLSRGIDLDQIFKNQCHFPPDMGLRFENLIHKVHMSPVSTAVYLWSKSVGGGVS